MRDIGLKKGKLYYLASPYTHKSKFIEQIRYEAVIYTASQLTNMGHRLIEPIGMCHDQSTKYELPGGYEFWKTRDRGFVELCDGIIILCIPGWAESVGVTDEIKWAKQHGKTIHYLRAEDVMTQEERSCLGTHTQTVRDDLKCLEGLLEDE